MFDKLASLLAPHVCLVCHKEGSLLCHWCKHDAVPKLPDRCFKCKSVSKDSVVCAKCRRSSPLQYVWVRAQYKDTAKNLVYKLKFARARAAAQTIAELLDDVVLDIPQSTIVTYIPAATSRVRIRGYDQSRLIARAFARSRKLPCSPLFVRIGQSRQVGSNRKQRIAQAEKNYKVINSRIFYDKEVLIIDDIVTTGATLESAARLLKKNGAKRVSAATFAQK